MIVNKVGKVKLSILPGVVSIYKGDLTIVLGDNGSKMWGLNGDLHRVHGAAVEYANGDKSWLLYGQMFPEAHHLRLVYEGKLRK